MKKLITIFILLGGVIALQAQKLSPEDQQRVAKVKSENQWISDLGNGFYKNPIVPGAAGNILAVKVGKDYYMRTSSGGSFLFYHSRDLINWKPVARHMVDSKYSGIWAEDFVYFNGKFHIYMPVGEWPGKTQKERDHQYFRAVFVISAEKIEGPWSEPVRVDNHYNPDPFYTGIDPGFIMSTEGKKYLYVDNGFMMPLNDEGTSSTAMARVVYDGWKYPEHWVVIGKCLEGPKLFYRKGYYYLGSAIGGDGAVSTSEMGIIARSKSPEGPWEESPYNPIVHTYSYEDPWWDLGHATILEGPVDDTWYLLVGGSASKYTGWGIGQQLLVIPLEFTADGWPIIKDQHDWNDIIPMPKGENVGGGMPLSDDFKSASLGIQWVVAQKDMNDVKSGDGRLVLKAKGTNSSTGTSVRGDCTNPSFEVEVEVECKSGVTAGLAVGQSEGLKFDGKTVSYNVGELWRTRNSEVSVEGSKVLLRIRSYKGNTSFFCSTDGGANWIHFQNGIRGGRGGIKLFAAGEGEAIFRNYKYRGIQEF